MQHPTEVKYSKATSSVELKKQQFYSTKERPELNPVLSALINEDIKKSIDAKRHAETEYIPTTASSQPLTTERVVPRNRDDSVVVDSITGSSGEKKQVKTVENIVCCGKSVEAICQIRHDFKWEISQYLIENSSVCSFVHRLYIRVLFFRCFHCVGHRRRRKKTNKINNLSAIQ